MKLYCVVALLLCIMLGSYLEQRHQINKQGQEQGQQHG